jgi:hypothetical protein
MRCELHHQLNACASLAEFVHANLTSAGRYRSLIFVCGCLLEVERCCDATLVQRAYNTRRSTRRAQSLRLSARCERASAKREMASNRRGIRLAHRRAQEEKSHASRGDAAACGVREGDRFCAPQRGNRLAEGCPHHESGGSSRGKIVFATGVRVVSPYCILRGSLYLPPSTDPFPHE